MTLSFLKPDEVKRKEKILREQEIANKKLQEIEAIENTRKSKIAAQEREYNAKLGDYQFRCDMFSVNADPFKRLCRFISECNKAQSFWNYYNDNKGYYNLSELEDFVNKTCKPGEQSPKQKEVDCLED